MTLVILLFLAVLSAIFGRMGGSDTYNTKWRDIGCNLLAIVALCLFVPFQLGFWWVYLIIFGLQWASFSTYWDWLFNFDNLWFSGFMVGISMMPAIILGGTWWVILIRAILLAVAWGLLNLYVRPIRKWNRAQVEEFCRYFVSQ